MYIYACAATQLERALRDLADCEQDKHELLQELHKEQDLVEKLQADCWCSLLLLMTSAFCLCVALLWWGRGVSMCWSASLLFVSLLCFSALLCVRPVVFLCLISNAVFLRVILSFSMLLNPLNCVDEMVLLKVYLSCCGAVQSGKELSVELDRTKRYLDATQQPAASVSKVEVLLRQQIKELEEVCWFP